MRTIGAYLLFNLLAMWLLYVGFLNENTLTAEGQSPLFLFILFGTLISFAGVFLNRYQETQLSYRVIIVGAILALPTLIPFGLFVIYLSWKKSRKLKKDSGIMMTHGKLLVITIPYLWMLLLFLLPFLIIFKISFSEYEAAMPPYTDLVSLEDGLLNIVLNIGNYSRTIFEDAIFVHALLGSLKIATISTILCILIGYPLAWAISQCKQSTRNILLLLIILPSWTSFLIRIYAWMGILNNNGLLNNFLLWLGIIDQPLIILNTSFAIYVGIVYAYLPFVILPIYTSLTKVDPTLVEAALDLGCKPISAFFKVIMPLTKNGVIAGGMLVFIPAVGEYVIPELLGGSTLMVARELYRVFSKDVDWPMASAVASLLLLILFVPIFYFNKFQNKQIEGAK